MTDIKNHFAQTLSHVSDILMNPVKENLWFEKNRPLFENDLLQNGQLDPKKIFIIIEAIEYKTDEEFVSTGQKKVIDDIELNVVESIPTTGHVKPKIQFTESIFTFDDYEKMLYKFDLKGEKRVPVDKYTQIVPFKNALETQFHRQASAISELHQQIAEEFGTLYVHTEQTMLNKQREKQPKDYKNKPPEGWSDLTLKLHSIFNQIQHGMSPEKINRLKGLDTLLQNENIDQDLAEKTFENIMRYCRKREPIVEKLRELTKRILPLESLIEDFNSDQDIKSIQKIQEKDAFKDMPDPSKFAKERARRNKDSEGSDVIVMTKALEFLRSYLVSKNIQKLKRKVNGIATQLIENTDGLSDSQRNTVREWVKSYFTEHIAMKKNG